MSDAQPTATGWPGSAAMVGSYSDAAGRHFFEVTERETSRAAEAIERVLGSFGFARGAAIAIVSLMDEAAQMLPLTEACVDRGLIVCNADASLFDAARLESIVRRFRPVAIFGVGADSLAGLAGLGHDPIALFGGIAVWARPDAYDQLAGRLPSLFRWVEVGPALGLECRVRGGAHVDGREWRLDDDGDTLRIGSRLPRRTGFDGCDTGLRATVSDAICDCGNSDPLVRPIA